MKKYLSFFLVLCMIFSLYVCSSPLNAEEQIRNGQPETTLPSVEGQDQREAIEQSRQALKEKQAEIQELQKQSADLQVALQNLESQSIQVHEEKTKILAQIQYASETLKQRIAELERSHEDLQKKRDEYNKRIRSMYYFSKRHWWEILFDSNGLEGFFTQVRMIQAIAHADHEFLIALEHSEEVLNKSKERAEQALKDYHNFLKQKEAQWADLQEGITHQRSQAEGLAASLQQRGTEEENLEATLQEQMKAQEIYEENSKKLAAQIAKMEQQNREKAEKEAAVNAKREREKKKSEVNQPPEEVHDGTNSAAHGNTDLSEDPKPSTPVPAKKESPAGDETGLLNPIQGPRAPWARYAKPVWPIPAAHEVWSPYGPRDLGFDRANQYIHTGVDLSSGDAAGSPVLAAWSGVVVTAQSPSQGQMYADQANYIQINHGGGLGSGYWHLLDVVVHVGQHVEAGDVIGHCGSTGMSTGPHLHFEVYDKNNPNKGLRDTCDPLPYLYQR